MSEWTNDLTNYLLDAEYEAINDLDNVIVDDVDDVNALFEKVRDIHMQEDIEDVDWNLTMVNRPNTVYIDRREEVRR